MNSIIDPIINITGMICYVDADIKTYRAICKVKYLESDTGDFKYIFEPNYQEIDLIGDKKFDGIQGLDLSLRLEAYTRENRIPIFISERVPSEKREDSRTLMMQENKVASSSLEWLINTKTYYSGDSLIVRELVPEETDDSSKYINLSFTDFIKLFGPESVPTEINRNDLSLSINSRTTEKGRPEVCIDSEKWKKVVYDYFDNNISATEASGLLGIGRATFFRKIKENKDNSNINVEGYSSKAKGRYANNNKGHTASYSLNSRFEAAQSEISKLDGAEFQRLCTRLINDKYQLDGLVCSGKKSGSYTTTKGTPDAFWQYQDGTFLAMEAGHVLSTKTNAINKIVEDIQKCIDYEKYELNDGLIKKIVICYAFNRLSIKDITNIKSQFQDCDIDLIGPDEIAKLVTENFPWIGREILNISYRSRAVMSLDEFIEKHNKSNFKAPLDLKLVSRVEELTYCCNVLENNQALILTGDAGSGKTKLAIEAARKYAKENKVQLIIVQSTKEDFTEELLLSIKENNRYIIIFDDANETSRIEVAVDLLQTYENVKAIATVRNYAQDKILNVFKDVKYEKLKLRRLQNQELDDVLKESFDIASWRQRNCLINLTKGNLRLIYFIKTSCQDKLLEETNFGNIIRDCYDLKTKWLADTLKDAIRISSILGAHQTFDNDSLNALLHHFDISHADYLEACSKLCEDELMDYVQNCKAVSFEEQNLRDYFLYEAIVQSKRITLKDIWSLDRGNKLLVRAVNILIQVFQDSITANVVKEQLEEIWGIANFKQKKDLIIKCHSLLGHNAAIFLQNELNGLTTNEQTSQDYHQAYGQQGTTPKEWFVYPIVEFLKQKNYQNLILNSFINLITEDAIIASDAMWIIKESLQYYLFKSDDNSTFPTVLVERLLEEYLSSKDDKFAFCLMSVAKIALDDNIVWHEYNGVNSITLFSSNLNINKNLVSFRENILKSLKEVYILSSLKSDILKVVFGYRGANSNVSKELFTATSEIIVNVFGDCIQPDNILHLNLCSNLREVCLRKKENGLVASLDSIIESSQIGAFLWSLRDINISDIYVDDSKSYKLAKILTLDQWENIIKALAKADKLNSYTSKLTTFLELYLRSEKNKDKLDLLSDIIICNCSYPLLRDIVFESIVRRYGPEEGRDFVVKTTGEFSKAWVAGFDSYCLSRSIIATNPNVYLTNLKENINVLDIEQVVNINAVNKGFLTKYYKTINVNTIQSNDLYFKLVPINEEERRLLTPFIKTKSVFEKIKQIVISQIENQGFVDEHVLLFIFKQDRNFISELFNLDTGFEEFESFESIASEFWNNYTRGQLNIIKKSIEEFLIENRNFYCLKKRLKSFIIAGYNNKHKETALRWLRSLNTDNGSKFKLWADVVCSLPNDMKTDAIISLCKDSIDNETFNYILYSIPFEGLSWMGSESFVVLEDIKYANKLLELLNKNKLFKYILDCKGFIVDCNKKLSRIEIEDFINDI